MKLFSNEWKDRIDRWIEALKKDLYIPLKDIQWETAADQGVVKLADAEKLEYSPVRDGYQWGREYEYRWFRSNVTFPPEAEGERIVMNLKPGHEATLFVDRQPFGTYREEWVLMPHHFLVDNTISVKAKEGETHEIYMEVYAGHFYPKAAPSIYTGPILPGEYSDWEKENRITLKKCTIGIWNEEAYQLLIDVLTLKGLLEEIDTTSLRAARIAQALKDFTAIAEFEQPLALRRKSYVNSRKALEPVLKCRNGSTMPTFSMIGNSHLDYVWLWPVEETMRKTARTFAAQLRLMDEYPEYRFIQSMPAIYKLCKEYYPDLYAKIKEKIAEGQWIADGAMYVEPDTNLTSGESLIRQIYYGQKFYKEEFGKESEVLWLPDTFGYSAVLPQILKKSGVRYLVTQKIFWSYNDGDKFPYHYFTWRGMDGSSVDSFLPTTYDYQTYPQKMNATWKERVQVDLEDFLIPYGYGDGGGGPTRDHVEYIRRQEDLEGGVKLVHEAPADFFHRLDAKGGPSHTFDGELYLNTHRGTFTAQARIKQLNRECDAALHNLEYAGVIAMVQGIPYPYDQVDELWMEYLKNQFHDILPGSSVHAVYVRAEEEMESIVERANILISELISGLRTSDGSGVNHINTISFPRVSGGGNAVDNTVISENDPVSENETGVAPVKMAGAMDDVSTSLGTLCEDGQWKVQNSIFTCLISPEGEITSFVLAANGREYAKAPLNHYRLFQDIPRMFDAWDIDATYDCVEYTDRMTFGSSMVENSKDRFVLEVVGTISESSLISMIVIEKNDPVIRFETTISWKETHKLLKTAFPTTVRTAEGLNEIQFGYIKRPATRNNAFEQDRFEVCNHRYSALCDTGLGAAVLNDCKYGIGMKDGSMELTLLRAPGSPDPEADRRVHQFTYGFMAFDGAFKDSDVIRQAYLMNVPEIEVPFSVSVPEMFQTTSQQIIIETVKPANDRSGDVILRLYESCGGSGDTELILPDWAGCCEAADLMERSEHFLPEERHKDGRRSLKLVFTPFEIKTIRVKHSGING